MFIPKVLLYINIVMLALVHWLTSVSILDIPNTDNYIIVLDVYSKKTCRYAYIYDRQFTKPTCVVSEISTV